MLYKFAVNFGTLRTWRNDGGWGAKVIFPINGPFLRFLPPYRSSCRDNLEQIILCSSQSELRIRRKLLQKFIRIQVLVQLLNQIQPLGKINEKNLVLKEGLLFTKCSHIIKQSLYSFHQNGYDRKRIYSSFLFDVDRPVRFFAVTKHLAYIAVFGTQ